MINSALLSHWLVRFHRWEWFPLSSIWPQIARGCLNRPNYHSGSYNLIDYFFFQISFKLNRPKWIGRCLPCFPSLTYVGHHQLAYGALHLPQLVARYLNSWERFYRLVDLWNYITRSSWWGNIGEYSAPLFFLETELVNKNRSISQSHPPPILWEEHGGLQFLESCWSPFSSPMALSATVYRSRFGGMATG